MNKVVKTLLLPSGSVQTEILEFTAADKPFLINMYRKWRDLTDDLKKIGARGINLPEGLSEAVFCLATNSWRITQSIPGVKTSFDCYNPASNVRIQVKAHSVAYDLTSFGPKSVWDELYLMDFFNDGKWDGTVDIYHIPNDYIYNHNVNRNQTFLEQQEQGRRPRFCIRKEIILKHSIQPFLRYHLI